MCAHCHLCLQRPLPGPTHCLHPAQLGEFNPGPLLPAGWLFFTQSGQSKLLNLGTWHF